MFNLEKSIISSNKCLRGQNSSGNEYITTTITKGILKIEILITG